MYLFLIFSDAFPVLVIAESQCFRGILRGRRKKEEEKRWEKEDNAVWQQYNSESQYFQRSIRKKKKKREEKEEENITVWQLYTRDLSAIPCPAYFRSKRR